jgi:hypothetical protein
VLLSSCLWWSEAEAKRPKAPVAAPAVAPEAAPPAPAEPAVPRFEKVAIPGCGCAAYLPTGTPMAAPETSPDGSMVWTVEQVVGGYGFGVIAVKLAEAASTPEAAEELLVSYLDFLKGQFEITGAAGVGRGHTLEGSAARGVIDFWGSKDGEQWSVKAWSTPTHLAVFLVHGPGEYPHPSVVEVFGNGLRFEGP